MPDVLVRDVPEAVVEVLKARAASHRRSLQGELLALLEQAAAETRSPAVIAARIRAALALRGGTFTDCVPLIREDRER